MTSRAGSLIVAVFLGGFALIAVLLIVILTDGDGNDRDAALVVPSLRQGDLLLLGEPVEIRVVARDDQPVTGVSLFVDGTLITRAVPVADPGQGTYSATLSWIPERLGSVTVTIAAISLDGRETQVEVQVEVTDDPERVRSEFRVSILSPSPLQRVARGQPVTVLVQAQAAEPIASFDLEISGTVVASAPVQETTDAGIAFATLRFTPQAEGVLVLRVRATTAGGADAVAEVTVEIVSGVEPPGQEDEGDADAPFAGVSGEAGLLVIRGPADGAEFDLTDGLTIDVVVDTRDTGRLISLELYVNTVLFQSIAVEPLADGSYRASIPFAPPAAGLYTLEVVAISEANRRFDARIDITVLAGEPEDDGNEDGDPTAEPPPEDDDLDPPLPDLRPIAISVGEGNAIVLTIANQGNAPVQTLLLISVVRTADGILLDDVSIPVAIAPTGAQTLTLPTSFTEPLDITVILDPLNAIEEADETNNELSAVFEPLTRPDLVAEALLISADGFAIVTIVNAGAAPVSGVITVDILLNGQLIETLSFSGLLAVQGSLQLAGSTPLAGPGTVLAIVDPTNAIAESNEANNAVAVELGG